MRRACASALSTRSFLLLGYSFQPTSSPLCGLASCPAWRLLHEFRRATTPPEATNMGPGFYRGSGGGARACGFVGRAGAHAVYYGRRCLSVCVCVSVCLSPLKWKFAFQKNLSARPSEARNQLAPTPNYARRRALPVCGSENPRLTALCTLQAFKNGKSSRY